jgi:hypothetical protein
VLRAALLALPALALLAGPLGAGAELNREGSLIASFDGGLAPKTLPRRSPAPVAVRISGGFKSAKKSARVPQLRTISVAINRSGRLYDKGIPTCRVRAIQPATEGEARQECGRSIVGHGAVTVQARIPGQRPFAVEGKLLAFNGPRVNGTKLIYAQVYSADPPGAFVLTFKVRHTRGTFGTVVSTTLPSSAQGWAYLTHFEMTLHRVYSYRGKRRSYVSAACGAPAGLPGVIFPFARARYGFDNGQRLTTAIARTCRVG